MIPTNPSHRSPCAGRLDAASQTGLPDRSDRGPIELCPHCGGTLRVIASIEDPQGVRSGTPVIARILAHIVARDGGDAAGQPRAPPQLSLGLGAPSSEQLPFFV